jgi:hypothetical protein
MSRLKASVNGALNRRILDDRSPPVEVMPQGDARMDVLANAVVRYDQRHDFVREIQALWSRAQATFLTIGQYLNMAKEKLPRGEFQVMVERELPFSPNTAFQIRMAAAAVSSGRLVVDRLPSNYSTIYQLSTLSDDALEQARQSGLLRPDLTRTEVLAFKKQIMGRSAGSTGSAKARVRRLIELRRQKAAIEAEIARLEGEEAA